MTAKETKARLDAIQLSDSLRDRLVDFCISDNFLRDRSLEAICRRIWQGPPGKGGLCSDVWVESAIPPQTSSDTLQTLQDEEYLSPWLVKHLGKSGEFPTDRLLYAHQAKAVKACVPEDEDRPAVILTAGTGSGKTESFLLPMLSDLAQHERTPGGGCRAIILYPMNALVNDQVERLYGWLKGQDKLHLCHFTGETPEDHDRANRENIPPFEACRHRTRQRARGLEKHGGGKLSADQRTPPPDVLITNYSMLEYMLCRPQDQVFFGKDLRTVILDEAHLYTGTLAAEITLLLRRLYQKCGLHSDQVLQFATSATIGTGSTDELQRFASTLFSKPNDRVVVIEGKKAESVLPQPCPPSHSELPESHEVGFEKRTIVLNPQGKECLYQSSESCDQLVPILNCFVDADKVTEERRTCEDYPAKLLQVLRFAPALHTIEETLRDEKKKQIGLGELTQIVWGSDTPKLRQATNLVIGLASSARESVDSPPLLPHRLHVMLRPSEGVSVCLNENCDDDKTRKLEHFGTVNADQKERCGGCGHKCLPVYRCPHCGESALACDEVAGDVVPPNDPERPGSFFRYLADSEQKIDTHSGSLASGTLPLERISTCPNCKEELSSFEPLECHGGLALSILAETTLAALPPLPSKDEGANDILPAQGRRLLAFSDSRSEAARLGPRLRRQHDYQLVRAAIVRLFMKQSGDKVEELEELESEIAFVKQRLERPNQPIGAKNRLQLRYEDLLAERNAMASGGDVAYWANLLRQEEAEALAQILDDERGEYHQADEWKQLDWKRNKEAALARSEELLANELVRLKKRHRVSVETIGVVEVVYPGLETLGPPDRFIGGLPTSKLQENIEKNWTKLLAICCDWLRETGSITLGDWKLDHEWQQDQAPIGRWMGKLEFAGATERGQRREFARNLLRKAGAPENRLDELAKELLEALFDSLLSGATSASEAGGQCPWLTKEQQVVQAVSFDALQLRFYDLALMRPKQLYVCSCTGHVWPREVLDSAPARGSIGTLRPVTDEELNHTTFVGRARREYRAESLVFKLGLWAEEHSAQLASKEARRLQELFQKGMRNLLSATTTLELGIDIGGLSGTLLSNVPPGKANYLQRAGRVGRRADGSSVVITCARSRPYDREVFRRIGDFLSRPLREPVVFLERERIVRRHFHSWLMGAFFEQLYDPEKDNVGAMDAFGRMGKFCGVPVVELWTQNSSLKPKLRKPKPLIKGDIEKPVWWKQGAENGLLDQYRSWVKYAAEQGFKPELDALFRDTFLEEEDKRAGLFTEAERQFDASLREWQRDYDNLLEAWKDTDEKERRQANHLCFKLNTLAKLTVIETLANARYLPRYGFPIGVLKLQVRVPNEETEKRFKAETRVEDQYRLERSSLLALREYVPGSQLLVGGKLITSRGIAKHWSGDRAESSVGLMGKAAQCINDHFFYWISDEKPTECPICEDKVLNASEDLIFPRFGFSSAAWDPPKRSVDVDLIGTVEAATTAFATKAGEKSSGGREIDNFAGIPDLKAAYREEGELMVFNRGDHNNGFAICTYCGYAESEPRTRDPLPSRRMQTHAPLDKKKDFDSCAELNNKPKILRHQTLCAREPTDIVLVDPSHYVRGGQALRVVTSLAVALKLAGARVLQLDSRELGVLVVPAGLRGSGWGAVIYDTVPGGAGHCLELLERGREWLTAARALLHGSEEHHRTCERACMDCILTFDAQALLDRRGLRLDRRDALALLDMLLAIPPEEEAANEEPEQQPEEFNGLPVLTLESLNGGCPPRFVLQLPTDALNKVVGKGSWCEFRRLEPDEELPGSRSIVIASHPGLKDREFGQKTIRSFRSMAQNRGAGSTLVVKLDASCKERRLFESYTLELKGDEANSWRPLALLERKLDRGDTPSQG